MYPNKKVFSGLWLRLAFLVPLISLMNVSCKDTSSRLGDVPPQPLTEVATMISLSAKSQIDKFAFAFHSYAKIQSELKGKSTEEINQAFRNRMTMQGTVSEATILEVTDLANALLKSNQNPVSNSSVGTQSVESDSNPQEAEASFDDLSSGVQSAIGFAVNALGNAVGGTENTDPNYLPLVGVLQDQFNLAASNAQSIHNNGGMSQEELTVTLEALYGAQASLDGIHQFIINNFASMQNGTAEMDGYPSARVGFCWRCFWRAVARVAVAIVVTAIIVAVPLMAVVAIKNLSLAAAAKISVIKFAKTTLVKGVLIQDLKVAATLMSGLAAGVKNASSNWHIGWKGLVEWKFGIKLTPMAYN